MKIQEYLSEIPNRPGWYLISSDVPLKVLEELPTPKNTKHCNIPELIVSAKPLFRLGLVSNENIYFGQTSKLKDRIRGHFKCPSGTSCLALGQYESLCPYRWIVKYALVDDVISTVTPSNDDLFRVIFEQAWRSYNGWPLLCKK